MSEAVGIDVERVTRWFEENVPGATPPLDFLLIAGGRSNLTFKVTDEAGQAWVLRRPPTGHVLRTAHDMAREHRIITALTPTAVPVPAPIGLCTDESVDRARRLPAGQHLAQRPGRAARRPRLGDLHGR